MEIEITARHVDVTDVVKDHARKRLQKIADEFPRLEMMHLILDVEKYRHMAEIVVQGRKMLRMEAREVSSDMYASIDAVAATIEKRLRRKTDIRKSKKSRAGRLPEEAVEPTEEAGANE